MEKIDDIKQDRKLGTPEKRTLKRIAQDIRLDWGNKMYFGAKPYVDAMATLDSIEQPYFEDSGESIVLYFLANAQTWKGPVARMIKEELKAIVKAHEKKHKR
ncbi:MAG TPA: hypothetical protein VIG47_08320 [Gemmatimonadaceae bacterium]|jgi:hypothetical protein